MCCNTGQNRVVMIAPKEDHIISQMGEATTSDCDRWRELARARTHATHSPCANITCSHLLWKIHKENEKTSHYFCTYTLIIILPECVELTCQPITWFSFSFCLVSSFYTDAFLFSLYSFPSGSHTPRANRSISFLSYHRAWVWVYVCRYSQRNCVSSLGKWWRRLWQAVFSDGRIKCQWQVISTPSQPPPTTATLCKSEQCVKIKLLFFTVHTWSNSHQFQPSMMTFLLMWLLLAKAWTKNETDRSRTEWESDVIEKKRNIKTDWSNGNGNKQSHT